MQTKKLTLLPVQNASFLFLEASPGAKEMSDHNTYKRNSHPFHMSEIDTKSSLTPVKNQVE